MTPSENTLAQLDSLRADLAALSGRTRDDIAQLKIRFAHLEKSLIPKNAEEPDKAPKLPSRPVPQPAEISPKPEVHAKEDPVILPTEVRVERDGFEAKLGKIWLVRIGISLLITGLVLLGNYAYQNWVRDLPAWLRLAALFAVAGGISWSGLILSGKTKLKRFGEVLLSGGLAFFYWCVYAAHHVERLRVIDSPVLAALFLLAAASGIVGVSLGRKNEKIAVIGLILSSYSTILQPLGWISFVSNIILSVAGVGLLWRHGWKASGIAAAAGAYGSFFWWQLSGVSGSTTESFVGWFLVPTWVFFALPGIQGSSDSFSKDFVTPRWRFWFTALNNLCFFGLFSLAWIYWYEPKTLWSVAAVFGSILLALGVVGRGQNSSAAVHVTQGLGLLSLALVLKLDGYHLPLGLAAESLVLVLTAMRFKTKIESVFSSLAGIAACALVYTTGLPVWAAALVASLVTLSALVRRQITEPGHLLDQFLTYALVLAGSVVAVFVWHPALESNTQVLTASILAVLLSTVAFHSPRGYRLTDFFIPGFAFAGVSIHVLDSAFTSGSVPTALLFSCAAVHLAGLFLWEKSISKNTRALKPLMTVLSSVATALAIVCVSHNKGITTSTGIAILCVSSLLLSCLGYLVFKVRSWAISGSLILIFTLSLLTELPTGEISLFHLLPTAVALALIFVLSGRHGVLMIEDKLSRMIARGVASLSWILASCLMAGTLPEYSFSLTAIVLALSPRFLPLERIPKEVILFLLLGLFAFVLRLVIGSPTDSVLPDLVFQVALITSGLCYSLQPSPWKGVRTFFSIVSAISLTIWLTLLVIEMGSWTGTVTLWAVLGFVFVSLGLWLRLRELRKYGFALLAVAIAKLFFVDVWDFTAFSRVVAFITLGLSLVGLGFFYNRVGGLLKRLIDDDSSPEGFQ